jgi:hypothetical protein
MRNFRALATATLALAMAPSVVVAQTNATPPTRSFEEILKESKHVPFNLKVVPTEMGCHAETAPGTLRKVDCLTPEEIAKYPPPAPCTGADGDAACGMQSVVTPAEQKAGIKIIPITEAYLEVTLAEYSSSADTNYGKGGYSLQLNSNWFQATPNTTGWVQFAYQDFVSSARFCVWNIHWPTNSNPTVYTPVCASVQSIPLTAKLQFTVGGFVCAGSCTYFRPEGTSGPAVLWGWIHWETLDASGGVCSSCASGTVLATAQDTEDLANNWT